MELEESASWQHGGSTKLQPIKKKKGQMAPQVDIKKESMCFFY